MVRFLEAGALMDVTAHHILRARNVHQVGNPPWPVSAAMQLSSTMGEVLFSTLSEVYGSRLVVSWTIGANGWLLYWVILLNAGGRLVFGRWCNGENNYLNITIVDLSEP